MPLHPQAQAFVDMLKEADGPPIYELSPEEARGIPAILTELCGPGPEVASVRDAAAPGPAGPVPVRVYEPAGDLPGTLIWYHGGGWVVSSVEHADALCRQLAVDAGCRVVSVDYRLAPEHRFPAAVDDSYAALEWVAAEVADGTPIAVGGDSAGGNLAAVVALRARDEQGPAIAFQLLVYPVTDHDYSTRSYHEYGDAGLLLGKREMEWFWDQYAPEEDQWAHPYATPLQADLGDLPPAYVVIAEHDPLRDEGLAYADRLAAAGVPVETRVFADQLHVFFQLVNYFDSANEAVADAGAAVRAALEAAA